MPLLPILRFPDPRLKTVAAPVISIDDSIRRLTRDMAETMYEAPGIGLAAGWQTAIARETWIFVQPSFRMMFYKNPILKNNKWQSYSPALELGVRRGL